MANLLNDKKVDELIRGIDREIIIHLSEWNEDPTFRKDANYLVNNYGNTKGKLTVKVKYRLLGRSGSQKKIERTVSVKFLTDAGYEVLPVRYRDA